MTQMQLALVGLGSHVRRGAGKRLERSALAGFGG